MSDAFKLRLSLLLLRLGVAAVFLVWTSDRIVNYSHNSGVMQKYYGLDISQPVLTAMGVVQLILVLAFIIGAFKRISYGFILLAHLATTIASAKRLFPPFEIHQLLYFGSLPMLGACVCLYLLREHDTLLSLPGRPADAPLP